MYTRILISALIVCRN